MKVAALIPARKGSVRLPNKNWQEVGGKPLFHHAHDHAEQSGVCDWVVVSSDDGDILRYAEVLGAVAIQQPQFEQTYNVMLEVVRHADREMQARNMEADAIVLLQPTSPLRTPEDVAEAVCLLEGDGVDAVVSVTEGADDIAFERRWAGRLEKLPDIVVPNGAIYAIKTKILREGGSWYGPYTYGHHMPKDRSIDIDTVVDLEIARMLWDRSNETRR